MKAPKLNKLKNNINQFGLLAAALMGIFGHTATVFLSTLIDSVVMPIFDIFLDEGAWKTDVIVIGDYHLKWGELVSDFIHLLLVGFVIFIALRWLNSEKVEE